MTPHASAGPQQSDCLEHRGRKNPPRHLTDTEKMPWSQRRDAANEKHMTGYECSHLNNSWVGGRQRGCAISAGLTLTEVQSAQHFSKPSDINTSLCIHTNMQTCPCSLLFFFFCPFGTHSHAMLQQNENNNKLWHSSDTWKSLRSSRRNHD